MKRPAKKRSSPAAWERKYKLPKNAPKWMKILAEGARQLRKAGVDLPSDMAINHDYYAHGAPKRA